MIDVAGCIPLIIVLTTSLQVRCACSKSDGNFRHVWLRNMTNDDGNFRHVWLRNMTNDDGNFRLVW